MRRFILLGILAFPAFAVDERPPRLESVPEVPEPPRPVQSGETLEPDSTVIPPGKKPPEQGEAEPESVDAIPSGRERLPEQDEEETGTVDIRRLGKKMIHEYRRGGRLYMVKVVPDIGPPYYFLDSNGDGKLDIRRSDLSQDTNVNMWKLLEWD